MYVKYSTGLKYDDSISWNADCQHCQHSLGGGMLVLHRSQRPCCSQHLCFPCARLRTACINGICTVLYSCRHRAQAGYKVPRVLVPDRYQEQDASQVLDGLGAVGVLPVSLRSATRAGGSPVKALGASPVKQFGDHSPDRCTHTVSPARHRSPPARYHSPPARHMLLPRQPSSPAQSGWKPAQLKLSSAQPHTVAARHRMTPAQHAGRQPGSPAKQPARSVKYTTHTDGITHCASKLHNHKRLADAQTCGMEARAGVPVTDVDQAWLRYLARAKEKQGQRAAAASRAAAGGSSFQVRNPRKGAGYCQS